MVGEESEDLGKVGFRGLVGIVVPAVLDVEGLVEVLPGAAAS